jgi:hypothetical protein
LKSWDAIRENGVPRGGVQPGLGVAQAIVAQAVLPGFSVRVVDYTGR